MDASLPLNGVLNRGTNIDWSMIGEIDVIYLSRLLPLQMEILRVLVKIHVRNSISDVIFWCVSHFPSDELTLFLRRKIEDFLCMTEGEDVESLIVSSMSDLFCCTVS